MSEAVEVRGLEEIIKKMQVYPTKLANVVELTMNASLFTLQEKVPSYPPPPDNSSYRRTGTLGRTLGSSAGGGASGSPDIFTVKRMGGGGAEGRFGTNLDYAPHVIGEGTQAQVHQGRWWTLKNVAEAAKDKLIQLWNGAANKMAAWLDGKGLL